LLSKRLLRFPLSSAKGKYTADASGIRIGMSAGLASVTTYTAVLSTKISVESLTNFEDIMHENDFSLRKSV
jgi:hypothetical protein